MADYGRSNKGFSALDIVLICFVALLMAGLFLIQADSAYKKIRDAKRVTNLSQIKKALVQFYEDNKYLPYPPRYKYNGTALAVGGWDYSSDGGGYLSFLTSGSREYLKKVPLDPLNDGRGDVFSAGGTGYAYGFICSPAGDSRHAANTYTLGAKLENPDSYKKSGRLSGGVYYISWETPISLCRTN